MRAITNITVRATANGLPDGSLTATRTEPTRAVPSEDPGLGTRTGHFCAYSSDDADGGARRCKWVT